VYHDPNIKDLCQFLVLVALALIVIGIGYFPGLGDQNIPVMLREETSLRREKGVIFPSQCTLCGCLVWSIVKDDVLISFAETLLTTGAQSLFLSLNIIMLLPHCLI
jgi:hypothetical protein